MLQIRIFHPTDSDAVRRLFAGGQMDFAKGTELEEEIRSYIRRSLSGDLSDIPGHYQNAPRNNFWVAEADGEIKGMVGIQYRSDEEAELRRMSVASDTRRQGIGRRLLETVETFCREQCYQRIQLTTATQLQPAIAMYQRYGFHLVGAGQSGKILTQRYVKDLEAPEIKANTLCR